MFYVNATLTLIILFRNDITVHRGLGRFLYNMLFSEKKTSPQRNHCLKPGTAGSPMRDRSLRTLPVYLLAKGKTEGTL